MGLIIILWFVVGFYAQGMNGERVVRLYRTPDPGQNLLTLVLGPIGLVLAKSHGGRWLFWRTNGRLD